MKPTLFGPDFPRVIAFQPMSNPPSTQETPYPAFTRLLALGGILLAFALRLHQLGAQSLWYDETVSVFLAGLPIPEIIAHTARDIHPPGYYLLLHLWGWLAQPTLEDGLEFLYVWPSLFWGVLLLPLLFALGRRFFTPRIALIALWFTAVNPYHIWYSQEVRMYTLGAGLGVLCLWSALSWVQDAEERKERQKAKSDALSLSKGKGNRAWATGLIHNSPFTIHHALFLYIPAAVAGLYTLYYFAFLLIALNVLVFWFHFKDRGGSDTRGNGDGDRRPQTADRRRQPAVVSPQSPAPRPQSLLPWLLANAAALLLWSPWLPVFWRQMTNPPVPPWRNVPGLLTMAQESLAALLVGQSPPLGMFWPWALTAGLLIALGLLRSPHGDRWTKTLLVFIFLPLLLLAGISLTVTPLYHIRYFFTYAAAGTLLVAGVLSVAFGPWRWLHAISLAGLFGLSGWGLHEFWSNPLYQADDHRSAVTALAAAWRPGDVVLVNAGWAYTALAVYWPTTPSAAGRQPALSPVRTRLLGYTNTEQSAGDERPPILMGGSVDGPASLGWGLAESDFYAVSAAETVAALERLAESHPRIWHYRLYDTVSDPDGLVRAWLDTNTRQRLDMPYPGRDFLRVQLFETRAADAPPPCPPAPEMEATFGDGVALLGGVYSPAPQAGSTLYATLCWEIADRTPAENLRTSLRLYQQVGGEFVLASQQDESPFSSPAAQTTQQTALAVPIPGNTAPGSYRLELIVYDGATGDPLPIADPRAIFGQRWPLAENIAIDP